MILRRVELVGEEGPTREVVVGGSAVVSVGDDGSANPSVDGPLLDFGEAIAFPALTNSHDHLEFNLYPLLGHRRYADYVEWGADIWRRDRLVISSVEAVPRSCRLRWGALKNLLCGVTTVAHHGEARDHLDRLSIDLVAARSIHSVRLARGWRWHLNAPISRAPYVFHVGEGLSPEARSEVDELIRWNLFGRELFGVHAMAMRAEQAASFRAVVWCPSSNEFLYGATADIAALKGHTTILFGSDSTLTADWNIWSQLRNARTLGPLTDRALFEAVTSSASLAWRRPNTGRVAAGHSADLVVARKKAQNRWDAFFAVEPEDILLVLRRGTAILYDMCLDDRINRLVAPGSLFPVRVGATEKRVAEDVPALLATIRRSGAAPNLPVSA